MNILVIGDIVGKPGRRALKNLLPGLQQKYNIEFTVANAENAAGGKGISKEVFAEIIGAGVDVVTMGNHVWDNREVFSFIDDEARIIRPANYPGDCPGQGYHVYTGGFNKKIAVINVSGRVFLDPLDCPFQVTREIIGQIRKKADIMIIDFHAEATSEKLAFAYYFDGSVNAVLGTHTHIQTADERILSGGTAYITDLGMTGPVDSILGMDKELVIKRFVTQRPVRFEVAKGPAQLQGVVLSLDDYTNQVLEIERICLYSE